MVGRVVRLDPTEHTVIGVTPESFAFTDTMVAPKLYAPATQRGQVGADRGDWLTDGNQERFQLIGRMRPRVTVADARAHLSVLTTALATRYPDSMEHSAPWVELKRHTRPFPQAAIYMALLLTIVMALALLACLIPSRRAATANPLATLNAE